MNRKVVVSVLALLLLSAAGRISAQGTAFFYQGRLNDGGIPATNVYDLRFALYDASTNGNLISTPQTNFAVMVNNGIFSTNVDFGAVFTGTNYWLSLGVRTNAGVPLNTNTFTLLWPRQPLLPVPYAIFANTASNVIGTLSATQLTGTLPSAQVTGSYFGAVNFTNPADTYLGTFSGNGLNLTSLNGSNITVGTVADARLTTNVALLNTNQVFSGVNVFNNASNSFTGSFFGNGLVGFIAVPSNSIQAVRDTGYLLLNSNLTIVTLPATSNLLVGDIIRITGAGSGGWEIAQNTNQYISGIFLNASNSAWSPANAPAARFVSVASSADGLTCIASANTTAPGIYNSTDGGKTWNTLTTTYAPFAVASSADGSKLAGAVYNGQIVYSTNFGGAWQIAGTSPSTTWTSITSSSDGTRLAATVSGGNIYTNLGTSWSSSGAGSQAWNAIASSTSGTNLVAAINGGKIYTSTNAGHSWQSQSGSATTNWVSVASSEDGTKLAAAASGTSGGNLYTSTDSGVTWTIQTNAPTAFWYHIACSADGGRLVAVIDTQGGIGGGIYVSANFGRTWAKQNVPNEDWNSVACSNDGTRMVAVFQSATANGIYYWQAATAITSSTVGPKGSVTGGPNSAVELQYVGQDANGNARFMPISGNGAFWSN